MASATPPDPETRKRGLVEKRAPQRALQNTSARTFWAPGPNSFEEGSSARGFLGMAHGASGGPKSGLAPAGTAGLAHSGSVVSPGRPEAAAGLQRPHALGSDDEEGLRPRTRPGLRTARCRPRAPGVEGLEYFRPLHAPGTSSPLDGRSQDSQSKEEGASVGGIYAGYVIPIGQPLLKQPIRARGLCGWREVVAEGRWLGCER